jgi:hypothetical protein
MNLHAAHRARLRLPDNRYYVAAEMTKWNVHDCQVGQCSSLDSGLALLRQSHIFSHFAATLRDSLQSGP